MDRQAASDAGHLLPDSGLRKPPSLFGIGELEQVPERVLPMCRY
jgi:hypothetical protein